VTTVGISKAGDAPSNSGGAGHFLYGLEPPELVRHILSHPPVGFIASHLAGEVPGFVAPFDLLTTADLSLRRRVERMPGARWWRSWLRWSTQFVGTTASEYLVLPRNSEVAILPARWVAEWAGATRLLIVKDIPESGELLFPGEGESAKALAEACRKAGYLLVEGQALAYVAIDFSTPAEYLSRLSAARRKDIRRKLKVRPRLRVEVLSTGSPEFSDSSFRQELYELYLAVYAQSEVHFDLLTAEYFAAVLQDSSLEGRLFLYWSVDGLIGFNLCFLHEGKLIDKYVGFRYPAAREYNLYAVSWMENLEYALAKGCTHYVAGWTDPEIKAYLGASFTFTRHAVYVRQTALRAFLRRFSHLFESDRNLLGTVNHG
jgi:hypothetical protein